MTPRASIVSLDYAKERAPINSRWGDWTVISGSWREKHSTGDQSSTYVMARCKCGTERKVNLSQLVRARTTRCAFCGAKATVLKRGRFLGHENPNWKGYDHPREPYEYKKRLVEAQNGICAWPPCGKPLAGRIAVDHRHDRCCPDDKTCWSCVRGAVHHLCNILHIAGVERAIALGGVMPDYIEAYLSQSTSNREAA